MFFNLLHIYANINTDSVYPQRHLGPYCRTSVFHYYLLGFIYLSQLFKLHLNTYIYSSIVQICIIESINVYIRMSNIGDQHPYYA